MTSSFRELLVSSSSSTKTTTAQNQNRHRLFSKYSNNFSTHPEHLNGGSNFQQLNNNNNNAADPHVHEIVKSMQVQSIGIGIAEDSHTSYERARNLWRSIHIEPHAKHFNTNINLRNLNIDKISHGHIRSRNFNGRVHHEEIEDVIFGGTGAGSVGRSSATNDAKFTAADAGSGSGSRDGIGRDGEKLPFMKQTCFLIKFLCSLNLLPCRWRSDTCQMEKRSPALYKLWFVTVALASWINFLFVLFRFIQEVFIHWKKLQRNDLSVIIGLWSGLAFKLMVAVVTHNFSMQPDTYISFTNQLLRLRMNPNRPEFRKDFAAAKLMGFFLYMRTAQLIVSGVTKANRPQFLYSLVPQKFRNLFVYTIYSIFQIYSSFNACVLLYFVSISIIMLDTTTSLLKTRFPPSVSQRSKLMMYKQLQILLMLYNNAAHLGLYFLKFYTLLIGTISCYGSIRFYDDLDLRIYLTMPLSFISLMSYAYEFYGKAGKIPQISQESCHHMFTMRNEMNRNVVKENRCYMQSCRKMVVAKIGRHVFPNIIRFVFIQTIRMMIVMSRKKG